MKKGILILTTLVLVVQLTLLQPLQTHAVGVDTVVKLVGGKAVVRALAEKAGMALSKKQVDNVAGFIEKKTYDGDTRVIDFVNSANNLTGTPSTSGFKKYILDPMSWLTGLDLIFLAVGAFQDGYEGSMPVGIMGQCINPIFGSNSNYQYIVVQRTGTNWYYAFEVVGGSLSYSGIDSSKKHQFTATTDSIYRSGSKYSETGVPKRDDFGFGTNNTLTQGSTTSIGFANYENTMLFNGFDTGCVAPTAIVPTVNDVVNISNVNSSVINHFDNDTYNQNTTYNIEIEMPDNPNYDDMTAWNGEDPQLGEALETIEPDRDGDGISDSLDLYPDDPRNEPTEKPEGSSWWEWLLGPLKAIGDFFADVGGFLLGILVPSADSVTGIFNGISDSFKAKIPIADQLGSFFGEIEEIQATETPTAPTFDVTMPVEWGGGTFPMIDFSYFDQWRNWVLNFIRFTAWFIFLKRLYARIPRMIY